MKEREKLRRKINKHFGENELKILTFDLGIDNEDLEGSSKSTKVISLMWYVFRHARLEDLKAKLIKERPDAEWDEINWAELETELTAHDNENSHFQPPRNRSWQNLAIGLGLLLICLIALKVLLDNSDIRIGPEVAEELIAENIEGFVPIKAGEFYFGENLEEDINPFTEHLMLTVTVPITNKFLPLQTIDLKYDFYISITEISNAQYLEYLLDQNKEPIVKCHKSYGGYVIDISKQKSDLPVVCVTWEDAMAYTKWLSSSDKFQSLNLTATLPSEAEWVKAARGEEDARFYPWDNKDLGNNSTQSYMERLNYGKSNVPKNPDFRPGDGLASVNDFPLGASPDGILNLVGNVAEWTRSGAVENYPIDFANSIECPEDIQSEKKRNKGGSFTNGLDNTRIVNRASTNPDEASWGLGFRIVLISSDLYQCEQ